MFAVKDLDEVSKSLILFQTFDVLSVVSTVIITRLTKVKSVKASKVLRVLVIHVNATISNVLRDVTSPYGTVPDQIYGMHAN